MTMPPPKMTKKIILKNISVIAPLKLKLKEFAFHRNEILELGGKMTGNDDGGHGSGQSGIILISAVKELEHQTSEEKVEETVVSLPKNGWIALPAFTDSCCDIAELEKENVEKIIKEKWSQGIGKIVALVSSSLEEELDARDSLILFKKHAQSDLHFYHDSSHLIHMDIQDDNLYTLYNNMYDCSISISPFPNQRLMQPIYYGSGNLSRQSISPWVFAQMKGPEQNFKHLLHDLTFDPNELLQKSIEPQTPYLPSIMILKIDPSWDMTSLDSILKSLFLHGGNKGQAAALYSSSGDLLHSCKEWNDILQQASMDRYYKMENDVKIAIPRNISINGNGSKHIFNSIPESVEAFKRGEFLVVVDNEDRENEGDLIIAGQDLTPEKAAFMIRYTSGVICAPASGEILDQLCIPPMVEKNQDLFQTAYTVSIDAKSGVTTGISAADRAHTINLLSSPSSRDPALFSRPGHVFPLRARPRGVLERVGHTEASIDLCKLAGKCPVAAISEIVLDDGRMARRDDLVLFAKKHGLLICCISDLVKFMMENN